MDISKLFGNKLIQNAALGTLKKAMKANELHAAVIRYNAETDELEFEFTKQDCALVPKEDLVMYQEAVIKSLENGTIATEESAG